MDYSTARDTLIRLLCCSVETLNPDTLKRLVKKRYKLWHPDKNHEDPERYRQQFMDLNEAYKVFQKGPEDSGTFSCAEDIFCHEEWDETWEAGSTGSSDYNSTPFDDEFFNASPKKNYAVPEELRLFFRSKTNRRAGKLFMLFCFRDDLHKKCLDSFSKIDIIKSFVCFAARTNKEIFCTLLMTHNEIRLMDLKKYTRKHMLMNCELFYAVHQFKLIDKLYEMYKEPVFTWGVPLEKKVKEEIAFNHKQLVDFANSHDITDVYTLMYEYAHLADPCDRSEVTKDHEDDHTMEVINAKRFVLLPDRSRVCKNAIECVIAKLYRLLSQMSNTQWLEMRSREFSERLLQVTDPTIFGEAFYYWKYCIKKPMFFDCMSFIIGKFTSSNCKTLNKSKARYLCLVGPYNCGKTTFAAAVCKFFEGVNININISKDRLPFYIGAAISKRFVLFDDVKGYKPKKYMPDLPTGNGISNLDDLREHLDGKIEVQLEKKNKNPVNQIFPQGIITMNLYKLPSSLKIRLHVLNFEPSAMYKRHRFPVTMDTIFIAMAIDNLVPCDKEFIAHIMKNKDRWMTDHRSKCSCIPKVSNGCFNSHFRHFYCRISYRGRISRCRLYSQCSSICGYNCCISRFIRGRIFNYRRSCNTICYTVSN